MLKRISSKAKTIAKFGLRGSEPECQRLYMVLFICHEIQLLQFDTIGLGSVLLALSRLVRKDSYRIYKTIPYEQICITSIKFGGAGAGTNVSIPHSIILGICPLSPP